MSKLCGSIEPLEARLAPAVVILNPQTAQYRDVDGDLVTITVSQGRLRADDFLSVPSGLGEQLQLIDLSEQRGLFDGADLTVTAVPTKLGGNGQADVGKVDATRVALRSIRIDGDLGDLVVGRNVFGAPALELLDLGSFGVAGLGTQLAGGDLHAEVRGNLGHVVIRGDFSGSFDHNPPPQFFTAGSFHVKGSIMSAGPDQDGNLFLGQIDRFRVDGSIIGDAIGRGFVGISGFGAEAYVGGSIVGGSLNGQLFRSVRVVGSLVGTTFEGGYINDNGAEGTSGSIFVGGSLIGGTGRGGFIQTPGAELVIVRGNLDGTGGGAGAFINGEERLGRVFVGGSVIGGGTQSGYINGGRLGRVEVQGDVIGGDGAASGRISSYFSTNQIIIGGSLVGGAGEVETPTSEEAAFARASGTISAHGTIGRVKIGNELRGGDGDYSGSIHVSTLEPQDRIRILSVEIGGSIVGGEGAFSGSISQGLTDFRHGAEIGIYRAHIGGSVIGGGGFGSGRIEALRLGDIRIEGDVRGGSGDASAGVGGGIEHFELGGSIVGGEGFASGGAGNIIRGFIHGNIVGGSAPFAGQASPAFGGTLRIGGSVLGGTAEATGYLAVEGGARVHIEGSLHGGLIDFTGSFGSGILPVLRIDGDVIGNGTVHRTGDEVAIVGDRLGVLHIGGSVLGATIRAGSVREVHITGDLAGVGGDDAVLEAATRTPRPYAFESIFIGGSMDHALIRSVTSQSSDSGLPGRIGRIVVAGNFSASDIAAGVDPGADGQYGTADDFSTNPATDQTGRPIARIGAVIIGGRAIGTAAAGDHFGIVAEQIGSVRVNGREIPLQPGPHNDSVAIAATGDVNVRETP